MSRMTGLTMSKFNETNKIIFKQPVKSIGSTIDTVARDLVK